MTKEQLIAWAYITAMQQQECEGTMQMKLAVNLLAERCVTLNDTIDRIQTIASKCDMRVMAWSALHEIQKEIEKLNDNPKPETCGGGTTTNTGE